MVGLRGSLVVWDGGRKGGFTGMLGMVEMGFVGVEVVVLFGGG